MVPPSSGCQTKIPAGLSAVETLFRWGTGWSTLSPGSGRMAQTPAAPPAPGTRQKLQKDFGMGTWRDPVQALLQARPAPKPEQDAQGHTEHLPGGRCHHLSGHHPSAPLLLLVMLVPACPQNTPAVQAGRQPPPDPHPCPAQLPSLFQGWKSLKAGTCTAGTTRALSPFQGSRWLWLAPGIQASTLRWS